MVVGGSSGIGRGVVEGLLGSGAKVIYASRTKGKNNSSAIHIEADVSNESNVSSLFKEVDRFGNLDFLVNAAGASSNTRLPKLEPAEWDFVLSSNLKSTFLCCRAAISRMKKNSFGRVVNISSIAGKEGNPNAMPYSAAKAGVIALTKSLGKELADKNIAVNCVTPAAAKTRIFDQISQEHIDYMLSKIPRNRFVKVEELASLVAWMSSDENSYTTAGVFDLSGGRATY